jgi:hypothetical protein
MDVITVLPPENIEFMPMSGSIYSQKTLLEKLNTRKSIIGDGFYQIIL